MAGVLDFLFGGDALKKAAGPTTSTPSAQPAGIDIGKMAQDAADKAAASKSVASKPSSPLTSPMTPQAPNGKGGK